MPNSELKAEALELFNAKAYLQALELYQYLANQGDLPSLATVGYFYHNGLGVEQSYAKAIECYKKAYILFKQSAIRNSPQGQFNLGAMYDQGLGCETNQEKALEWCRKASFVGHQKAKDIMYRMQQDGQIVF